VTKSFEEIVEQFKAPESEWEVLINGQNFTNRIELIELEHKINNSMKFTIKLSGVESTDKIPVDSEAVVRYDGGEILRGVLKEFNPNENNEYVFEGAGYAVELEADSKTVFNDEGVENPVKDTTVQEIVDTLVLDTALPNNRTLSTEFSGGSGSIEVNDFRVKKRQMSDVNRLVGEYSLEWYVVTDSSNNPVLEVTDQTFFSAAPDNAPGNPKETFKTFGKDQNATRVEQNVNRNIGDFDGVVVRGFGDGDDQIEAKSKNDDFGKGSRTLIYTDKTILSQSQAQRKADNLSETQTVDWQEVEVEPMNPNQIFGIGDEIKVNSERARLSDTFRVVELYYKIHPERQILESKINLSNKPQTFVDDFKRLEETSKSQTDFGQGNRNTINETERDLADSENPLNIDFNVPERFVKDEAGNDRTAQVRLDFVVKNTRQTFDSSSSESAVIDSQTDVVKTEVDNFGEISRAQTKKEPRSPDNDSRIETTADTLDLPSTSDGGSSVVDSASSTLTLGDIDSSSFTEVGINRTPSNTSFNAGCFINIAVSLLATEDTAGSNERTRARFKIFYDDGTDRLEVTPVPLVGGLFHADDVEVGSPGQFKNLSYYSPFALFDDEDVVVEAKLEPGTSGTRLVGTETQVYVHDEHDHQIQATEKGGENVQAFTFAGPEITDIPSDDQIEIRGNLESELEDLGVNNKTISEVEIVGSQNNDDVYLVDFISEDGGNTVINIQSNTLDTGDATGSVQYDIPSSKNSSQDTKSLPDQNKKDISELDAADIILQEDPTEATDVEVKVNGTTVTTKELSGTAPFRFTDEDITAATTTPGENTVQIIPKDSGGSRGAAQVKVNVVVDHKIPGERK